MIGVVVCLHAVAHAFAQPPGRPSDDATCSGKHVPPTGDYDYEVAFHQDLEQAQTQARDQLVKRLCGEGPACARLREATQLWKTPPGCAMVTIRHDVVAKLRDLMTSVGSLEKGLDAAAKKVVPRLPASKGGKVRVVLAPIEDLGLVGGPRAAWMADRLAKALGDAGAMLTAGGRKAQRDVVVHATLFERSEERVPVVEIQWYAEIVKTREHIRADPARCAIEAVPGGAQAAASRGREAQPDPGLRITFDTERGGAICEGELLNILVESDTDLHLRIFDLYGVDGAMLVFPNEEVTDARIKAGVPLALGGDRGFEVLLAPGTDHERYLVVGAKSEADLGPFAKLKGTCLLGGELKKLVRAGGNDAFPSTTRVVGHGFRVVREGCAPVDEAKRKAMVEALARVPVCR